MAVVLTIAGSDSGGGAGVQADLRTLDLLGVYGASVITAVTAQNTKAVTAIFPIPPEVVLAQLQAVMTDIEVRAVKTGMLYDAKVVEVVAETLRAYPGLPVVVDPVVFSKSKASLLEPSARKAMVSYLFPIATVLTPNASEASLFLERPVGTVEEAVLAAMDLSKLGPKAVVVKGGHLGGGGDNEVVDVLYDGASLHFFRSRRHPTKNLHGAGCTFATSVAAGLACGLSVVEAVSLAHDFVHLAIEHADDLNIGGGFGPLNHWAGEEVRRRLQGLWRREG